MRRINVETITQNIKEMCIEANHFLSPDMKKVFDEAAASEESPFRSARIPEWQLCLSRWDRMYI